MKGKEKRVNYKKEFTLNGTERRVIGIFLILIELTLISGLIYYGFKDWMVLAWIGKLVAIWLMISKTKYYGV